MARHSTPCLLEGEGGKAHPSAKKLRVLCVGGGEEGSRFPMVLPAASCPSAAQPWLSWNGSSTYWVSPEQAV